MPNPRGKKKSTMWFCPVTIDLINNNYKKDGAVPDPSISNVQLSIIPVM